ncbi:MULTISPECIES: invasion associated locus B family protein [unclassified Pannonibacter]|uniref:invasion associated locus B family protein n=1 Tax=unclassified Pannonibacter TaxID=2627228 RepID=UPI0016461E55|nr:MULTISPECIES: invasion associated locus B family protein [unclassified Pannonibacter]
MNLKLASTLAGAAMIFSAGLATAQTAGGLPSGASSVKETFDDWTVTCLSGEGGKRCAISQQQQDQQTRQMVLLAEFAPAADGTVNGTLVLPFGLNLDGGVKLTVDDQEKGTDARFQTCMPVGCVVPLTLNKDTVAAIRKGNILKLGVQAVAGNPLNLQVSLKGFSAALDRSAALLK